MERRTVPDSARGSRGRLHRLCVPITISALCVLVLVLLLRLNSLPAGAAQESSTSLATVSSLVTISKSVNLQMAAPGQTLVYTLTARNTSSTSDTVSLVVTDTVPPNTSFESAGFIYPDGGSVAIPSVGGAGVITWTPASILTPTGYLQVYLTVQVRPNTADGTLIANAAYGVSEAQSGAVMGVPVTTTVVAPALAISKRSDLSQVCGNQRITYTLAVTNTGHFTSAGPISVMDRAPSFTVYAASWPTATFDPASGWLTWTLAGPFAPGQAMTVAFAVTNPASTPYGTALVNDLLSAIAPDAPGEAIGAPLTVTAVNLKAGFTNTVPLLAGRPATFYNASTGATGYTWNFGDGSPLVTVTNPAHAFSDTGSFGVVLTATGLCGADVAAKTLNVISSTASITSYTYLPLMMRDYPLVIGFSKSTYSAGESAGAVAIAVTLSQVSSVTVTVDYSTTNGTATSGTDYTATHGTLVLPPGQISQTFSVGIISDTLEEPNETLTLTLANPTGARLGLSEASLVILDDDRPIPPCAPQVWYTLTSEFSPMGIAYDAMTDRLFVANRDGPGGGSLSVMDVRSRVTTHVVTGLLSARGAAFDASRNLIYVVGWDWLNVVDGTTYTVTRLIRLGTDVDAYAVAYSPVKGKLYISGFNSHTILIVNLANWSVTRLNHTTAHPIADPSYIAVNSATGQVYVTNHTGLPSSWVTVIDGDSDSIVNDIYLAGDLYGITADSVHNMVYVASISAARLFAIDGATNRSVGDIIVVRASDSRKVPLRMAAVNPSVGGDLHLWLTSSSDDWHGMDRLILISGGDWQHLGQPRATQVMPSPEEGLLVDPVSWNVFVGSAASNLVTASHDGTTICSTPLSASPESEQLFTVVNDYRQRRLDR